MHDPVNHPDHYTQHPSGVECFEVARHLSFAAGNCLKYLWRADQKNGVEDYQKALWYLDRTAMNRTPLKNISKAHLALEGTDEETPLYWYLRWLVEGQDEDFRTAHDSLTSLTNRKDA